VPAEKEVKVRGEFLVLIFLDQQLTFLCREMNELCSIKIHYIGSPEG
jgi:hypothetical protein